MSGLMYCGDIAFTLFQIVDYSHSHNTGQNLKFAAETIAENYFFEYAARPVMNTIMLKMQSKINSITTALAKKSAEMAERWAASNFRSFIFKMLETRGIKQFARGAGAVIRIAGRSLVALVRLGSRFLYRIQLGL